MQFVNNTDEPITLEPGEGVTGTTSVHSFNGKSYRLQLDARAQKVQTHELITAEDVEEFHD